MEATADVKGILGKIMPPKLEDAGLEDCALPPDAIKLAFAKAASAVRSVISSDDDEETEGSCVNNPWTVAEGSSDELVGIGAGLDHLPGSCGNQKGLELPEFAGSDAVAVQDEDLKADEVVIGGGHSPPEKACIDELQGLQIEEKKKSKGKLGKAGKNANHDDDDGDESEGEKESNIPILTEAYV